MTNMTMMSVGGWVVVGVISKSKSQLGCVCRELLD